MWAVSTELLCILSAQGVVERSNPAWGTILGMAPADVDGRRLSDFLHPEDRKDWEVAFARVQAQQPVQKLEVRFLNKAGTRHWLSWNFAPEGAGYFCSGRDVTEEKENLAALRSKEEEAQLRDQFIAVLGHDLRNPVAAVGAAGRILRREAQSARALKTLDALETSLDRMSGLIDNLLDFANAQLGGGIYIRSDPNAHLLPVLRKTAAEARLVHPDCEFVETYQFSDPVECDTVRISQLFSNLLSNAATHGAKGTPIEIMGTARDGTLCLSVSNQGNPISPNVQKNLFQPFFRSDESGTNKGLGLGLFIASQIAAAHDGTLSVTSDDSGTVFSLELATQRQPVLDPA